ncbi:Uncharacterised protein [Halioglobus japonicus]|nr:Uncharacterised protein [Halioglobus japonicus]
MEALPSSFRDNSGFVFSHSGCVYRQVNRCYAEHYQNFMSSGLYQKLVEKHWLVSHEELTDGTITGTSDCYKILKPQQIPYISYPYEWSFSQLKDAAILTLRIQHQAMKHGFMLKDASAFNIQFLDARPVFIDTLSFEPYVEGRPWVAYKQFCQHFLAPLALMSYRDAELSKLMISHIDGIPLSLASKLLPLRTRLNYALAAHIHFHSKLQQDHADDAGTGTAARATAVTISAKGLTGVIESLAKVIEKLRWKMPDTEWGDYYQNTNYSSRADDEKHALVESFLQDIPDALNTVQDLGANTGEYSQIAARYCQLVLSQDIDPVAVEMNYRQRKSDGPSNILPLVQNLVSPTPAIGWGNAERSSFMERAHCDALLALALIHHLAISNNVPLDGIAAQFAELTKWLIIEFVPKSDSQVVRLLATREDIFPSYTREGFEQAFCQFFQIERAVPVPESERILYLMRTR